MKMAKEKTSRLGTGLSALFGEEENVLENETVQTLPISRVEPRKDQPRREFDPAAIEELAASIREYGLIQPITVRPLDKGYYQIIAGERRWRASRAAGLKEVPVRILEADDKLAMELALVENLQREDLNPMEEAAGYKKLMDDYGLTQEQVATRVQKSRPAVTNALRLLSLGETLQKKVSSGKLSAGHARALLPLKTETLREKAAAEVESRGLSVRQTETLVASLLRQAEQTEKEEKKPPVVDYVREAEKALSDALGRGVKFQGGQKKGRIALEFYSADDREALMEALRHMDKPILGITAAPYVDLRVRVSHWPRHPKPRLPQKLKGQLQNQHFQHTGKGHSLPGCFQRQNQVRRKDSRMKRRHRHIKPRQSQRQKSRRIPDQP